MTTDLKDYVITYANIDRQPIGQAFIKLPPEAALKLNNFFKSVNSPCSIETVNKKET